MLVDKFRKLPVALSPDGRMLTYVSWEPKRPGGDIAVLDLQTRKSAMVIATPFDESSADMSPDGKWIVYQSDESGRPEIYVQTFPEPTGKWIVSRGGGTQPMWSRDGREIYYVSADRRMTAVPVSTSGAFTAGTPAALFSVAIRGPFGFPQYDVTADGARFLVNRMVAEEGKNPMTLVQGWSER
jgi:Tol biopolymer transport system component